MISHIVFANIFDWAFSCCKERNCIISRNCENTWKLISRTRQVHSLPLKKQQKVIPFYAFRSVTKIIEVGNFAFPQSNPCIRCSWWVYECFIDKFRGIQRKRFSTICGTYQYDIIFLLTTIFQTLVNGLRINVQINAVVFQDFLDTQKPFSIAIFHTGSVSILIKNFDTWFRIASHSCRCILCFPCCANKLT